MRTQIKLASILKIIAIIMITLLCSVGLFVLCQEQQRQWDGSDDFTLYLQMSSQLAVILAFFAIWFGATVIVTASHHKKYEEKLDYAYTKSVLKRARQYGFDLLRIAVCLWVVACICYYFGGDKLENVTAIVRFYGVTAVIFVGSLLALNLPAIFRHQPATQRKAIYPVILETAGLSTLFVAGYHLDYYDYILTCFLNNELSYEFTSLDQLQQVGIHAGILFGGLLLIVVTCKMVEELRKQKHSIIKSV